MIVKEQILILEKTKSFLLKKSKSDSENSPNLLFKSCNLYKKIFDQNNSETVQKEALTQMKKRGLKSKQRSESTLDTFITKPVVSVKHNLFKPIESNIGSRERRNETDIEYRDKILKMIEERERLYEEALDTHVINLPFKKSEMKPMASVTPFITESHNSQTGLPQHDPYIYKIKCSHTKQLNDRLTKALEKIDNLRDQHKHSISKNSSKRSSSTLIKQTKPFTNSPTWEIKGKSESLKDVSTARNNTSASFSRLEISMTDNIGNEFFFSDLNIDKKEISSSSLIQDENHCEYLTNETDQILYSEVSCVFEESVNDFVLNELPDEVFWFIMNWTDEDILPLIDIAMTQMFIARKNRSGPTAEALNQCSEHLPEIFTTKNDASKIQQLKTIRKYLKTCSHAELARIPRMVDTIFIYNTVMDILLEVYSLDDNDKSRVWKQDIFRRSTTKMIRLWNASTAPESIELLKPIVIQEMKKRQVLTSDISYCPKPSRLHNWLLDHHNDKVDRLLVDETMADDNVWNMFEHLQEAIILNQADSIVSQIIDVEITDTIDPLLM